MSTPVLRLARTGDEGPRRLRAEGHLPRPQPASRSSARAGVVIVADNPSRTLQKISEIYDRIAFAAVGLYSEYQLLRIAGVRHADLKGYSYSREDVSAKELANAYSQTLHQIFTHEMKPYEVEMLVAEVGHANDDHAEMYHVLYDGVVIDEQRLLRARRLGRSDHRGAEGAVHRRASSLGAAIRLGAQGARHRRRAARRRRSSRSRCSTATRPRRAFRRIKNAELEGILARLTAHARVRSAARCTARNRGDRHEQRPARRHAPARHAAVADRRPVVVEDLVGLVDLVDRAARGSRRRPGRRGRTRRPAPSHRR